MGRDPVESGKARLRLLAADYALGMVSSWDVPSVADGVLQSGVYADALFELASVVHPTRSDIEPLLGRTLRELGVAAPSRTEAIWLAARSRVETIIAAGQGERLRNALMQLAKLSLTAGSDLPGQPCTDIGLPGATYAGSNIDAAALIGLDHAYDEVGDGFDASDAASVAREESRCAALDERTVHEANQWLVRHPE